MATEYKSFDLYFEVCFYLFPSSLRSSTLDLLTSTDTHETIIYSTTLKCITVLLNKEPNLAGGDADGASPPTRATPIGRGPKKQKHYSKCSK